MSTAYESESYCQEVLGIVNDAGLEITELSTHLQGQLIAVHSAYDEQFDGFAPAHIKNNTLARKEWAINQLIMAAKVSKRLGLTSHATFQVLYFGTLFTLGLNDLQG